MSKNTNSPSTDMGRYASQHLLKDPKKVGLSRAFMQVVHYKNTRETAAAVSGKTIAKARAYLEDVLEHRQAIPFRRHKGGVGRTAQGKAHGVTQARWPVKSVRLILKLLQEAEANAARNDLDSEDLVILTIVVNQASRAFLTRRTYRAHGRVNAYAHSPCHVEVVVGPAGVAIPKASEVTSRSAAQQQRTIEA